MAIDLNALARAAEGNPDVKVSVRKPWLREVHRQLAAGAKAEAELARRQRGDRVDDLIRTVFGRPRPI